MQPCAPAPASGRLEWPVRRELATVTRGSPTRGSSAVAPNAARADAPAHKIHRLTEFSPLDRSIAAARDALISLQSSQGYWLFELEADCTIPAEYVLMTHFLDEIDASLEPKLAAYLRARQAEHGGWPLYHGGDFDMSCSVKAYFALKLAGDSPQAPHMVRARAAILQRGGAARCNVFTRITLALFGQLPWRGVPYIPVEIVLLPRWFPFHLDKVSYWSRTVMVPLLILCTRQPAASNPRKVQIRELFTTPPEEERHSFRRPGGRQGVLSRAFLALAASVRALDWLQPLQLLDNPGDWRVRRPQLAGGGWAFQFSNAHYPDLDDTAVVAWSMHQAGDPARYAHNVQCALDWLVGMQSQHGGFASFDVDNTHYYLNEIPFADHGALLDPPTSDVTARVVTVLVRVGRPQDQAALARAIAFLRQEQEADGSWFGRSGTNYMYGTWSVLTAFADAGTGPDGPAPRRAVSWLTARQNADGGWGESNDTYAYGQLAAGKSPSVPHQSAWALLGLLAAGEAGTDAVRRGVGYLLRTQPADGLWRTPS